MGDFCLLIAEGKIPGKKIIQKFGKNPAVGTSGFDTIWNDPTSVSDIKANLIKDLEFLASDKPADLIYFITLFNLFQEVAPLVADGRSRPLLALYIHDPKTTSIDERLVVPFDGEAARWKASVMSSGCTIFPLISNEISTIAAS